MSDSIISILSLTVTPGVRINTLQWTAAVDTGRDLPYLALDKYQIWAALSNNRAGAVKVGETSTVQFIHGGLLIGAPRYYWLRPRDVSGNLGDFYPASETGGLVGIPVPTGPGTVGSEELTDGSVTNPKYQDGSHGETISGRQTVNVAITPSALSDVIISVPLPCRGGVNLVYWQGVVETLAKNGDAYGGGAVILYRNGVEVDRVVGFVDDDFDQKVNAVRTFEEPAPVGTVVYSMRALRFPGQGWFGFGLQGSALLYATRHLLIATNHSKVA